MTDSPQFPRFVPHPLLRGGHLQTLAAVWLPPPKHEYRAISHRVAMPDGDQFVLHDDCPADWQPGHRTALLIHGLCGCHLSSYMVRIAARLNERGVRTFRMDLRGCGAAQDLARLPYHSGQTEDPRRALERIAELCPDSPTTVIGFSLGGNITLKLMGEEGGQPTAGLDSAVAVNPPIDLLRCVQEICRIRNRAYDRYFVRLLLKRLADAQARVADMPEVAFPRPVRRLREFDDWYTAPLSGFGNAENYYRTCSSKLLIPQIRLPTLILTAANDPLVPAEIHDDVARPDCVQLHVAAGGGHLGYVAAAGIDPDRRWLDWRVSEWVASLGHDAAAVHNVALSSVPG